MSNLKANLKRFILFFTQHPTCVSNALLLAATTGFEQGFEYSVFDCPREQPDAWYYVLVMLLAPAFALFIVGILGSNLAWRLCQGMQQRSRDHGCTPWAPCCGNLATILLRAAVIPLTWWFVALMDGDLFVCYKWRPNCTDELILEEIDCTNDPASWDLRNKIQSQFYAWYLLAACLGCGLIAVFLNRYYGARFYFSHIYSNTLKRSERMHMEKLLKTEAEKDAELHIKAMIWHHPEMTAENWESVCREYTKTQTAIPADTAVKKTGDTAVKKTGDTAVKKTGDTAVKQTGDTTQDGANQTGGTGGLANSNTKLKKYGQFHSAIHEYLVTSGKLEEYKKAVADEAKKQQEKSSSGGGNPGNLAAPGGPVAGSNATGSNASGSNVAGSNASGSNVAGSNVEPLGTGSDERTETTPV